MLLIKNPCLDAYYNLASEEYFLDHLTEPAVILWRNENTVVIGKNQNTSEEIDVDYVRAEGIKVVRRLSGGGAVFHDSGNINYTIIRPYRETMFNDFATFSEPVRAYLKTLGITAELSGRNDLLIDGMKISGIAQAVRNNNILFHGTLLFDTNAAHLAKALKPKPLKMESKGIKSVSSRVTNIAAHCARKMTPEEFLDGLYAFFLQQPDTVEHTITAAEQEAISALRDAKYATWEWNFGASPKFAVHNEQKFSYGLVEIGASCEHDCITEIKIYGDFFGKRDVGALEERLTGVRYTRESVREALDDELLSACVSGMTKEDFCTLLFG